MTKTQTQVADIRSQDREYERRGGMRTRNRNNNKVSNAAAVVVQNNNSGYNENDSVTSTLTSRSQSSLETPTKNRVIQRRASTTQSPSCHLQVEKCHPIPVLELQIIKELLEQQN